MLKAGSLSDAAISGSRACNEGEGTWRELLSWTIAVVLEETKSTASYTKIWAIYIVNLPSITP